MEREMAFLTLEVRLIGVVLGEEEEDSAFLVFSLKLLGPLRRALGLVGLSIRFHCCFRESVDLLAGMGALGGFSICFTPLVPVSFCSHGRKSLIYSQVITRDNFHVSGLVFFDPTDK